MFDTTTLATFVLASAAIIVVPGPAQALVLARTLSDGPRAGVLTALGLNLGTLVHALAAGIGTASVLATSALAFDAVKYAGAAYLIYLGVQSWRAGRRPEPPTPAPAHQALARAVVTGILNPKLALFFVAFLPQFVDPARGSVLAQCLLLGTLLATMDIAWESGLVVLSTQAAHRLRSPRVQHWQRRITGSVLVALGLRLAVADRR